MMTPTEIEQKMLQEQDKALETLIDKFMTALQNASAALNEKSETHLVEQKAKAEVSELKSKWELIQKRMYSKSDYDKWLDKAKSDKTRIVFDFLTVLEEMCDPYGMTKELEAYQQFLFDFVECGVKHVGLATALLRNFSCLLEDEKRYFKDKNHTLFKSLIKLCKEQLFRDEKAVSWIFAKSTKILESILLRTKKDNDYFQSVLSIFANLSQILTLIKTKQNELPEGPFKGIFLNFAKVLRDVLIKNGHLFPAKKEIQILLTAFPRSILKAFIGDKDIQRLFKSSHDELNPQKLSLTEHNARPSAEGGFFDTLAKTFCPEFELLETHNYEDFGSPRGKRTLQLRSAAGSQFHYDSPSFSMEDLREGKVKLFFDPQDPSHYLGREISVGHAKFDAVLQVKSPTPKSKTTYRYFFEFNGVVFHYHYDIVTGMAFSLNARSLAKDKLVDILNGEHQTSINVCIQISQTEWDKKLADLKESEEVDYSQGIMDFFKNKIPVDAPHREKLVNALEKLGKKQIEKIVSSMKQHEDSKPTPDREIKETAGSLQITRTVVRENPAKVIASQYIAHLKMQEVKEKKEGAEGSRDVEAELAAARQKALASMALLPKSHKRKLEQNPVTSAPTVLSEGSSPFKKPRH